MEQRHRRVRPAAYPAAVTSSEAKLLQENLRLRQENERLRRRLSEIDEGDGLRIRGMTVEIDRLQAENRELETNMMVLNEALVRARNP